MIRRLVARSKFLSFTTRGAAVACEIRASPSASLRTAPRTFRSRFCSLRAASVSDNVPRDGSIRGGERSARPNRAGVKRARGYTRIYTRSYGRTGTYERTHGRAVSRTRRFNRQSNAHCTWCRYCSTYGIRVIAHPRMSVAVGGG